MALCGDTIAELKKGSPDYKLHIKHHFVEFEKKMGWLVKVFFKEENSEFLTYVVSVCTEKSK